MDRVCPNDDKNLESLIAIHCFPIFEMVAFRLFTFIGRNCRTILVSASMGLHFEPNSMCTKVDYEWTDEKNECGKLFVLLAIEMNFSRYLKLIVSSSVLRNVNLKSYFIRIWYLDWFSRKKVLKHYLKSICWVEDWIPTDILRNVVTYFFSLRASRLRTVRKALTRSIYHWPPHCYSIYVYRVGQWRRTKDSSISTAKEYYDETP